MPPTLTARAQEPSPDPQAQGRPTGRVPRELTGPLASSGRASPFSCIKGVVKIPHLVSAIGTLAFHFPSSISIFQISPMIIGRLTFSARSKNSSTTRGIRATAISRNLLSWVWTNQSAELTYSHRWCNKCTNMGLQQQDTGTYCLVEYVREYVCLLPASIVQKEGHICRLYK